MTALYQQIALDLAKKIETGVFDVGEKMPGIRALKTQLQISNSTAVAAYRQLEDEGYIASRPRSGFYVRQLAPTQFEAPGVAHDLPKRPKLVAQQARLVNFIEQAKRPHMIKLGAATPDVQYLPLQALKKLTHEALKIHGDTAFSYEEPLGSVALRQQIFKRMAQLGCNCRFEDILITNGCNEAVLLSLRALTKAGDTVAIESPAYHGHVQLIEALGLKAIEIPCEPRQGISLSALELALEQWPIKACLLIPNYSNPLGAVMSEKNKKALIKLAKKFDVMLIEDDIYGDIHFSAQRPAPLKACDQDERVIYCSSFSKSISPGMRVGWLAHKTLIDTLEYQKIITNISAAPLPQYLISAFLKSGRYEKHLRLMRVELEKSMMKMRSKVAQYFPKNTKMTAPRGGYVLWLELPEEVCSLDAAELAFDKGISIAAGPMFSSSGKYRNYIRLAFAIKWTDEVDNALQELGKIVKYLSKNAGSDGQPGAAQGRPRA